VEAGPLLALLFLNNNLHHTHHARPGAPWYRLPSLARTLRSAEVAAVGAGRYRSYTDVVRRHFARPLDGPVHPDPASVDA
jgi:fatty acid desaturase